MQIREIQPLIDHVKKGGDYSTLELAACNVARHMSYYQTMYSSEEERYNWYRLSPGSTQLAPLNTSNDGSFDGSDAQEERWQAWPNALDASYTLLLNEAARRSGQTYTRCFFCTEVAFGFCFECDRAVCVMHYRQNYGNDQPRCPDHFKDSFEPRKRHQHRSPLPQRP